MSLDTEISLAFQNACKAAKTTEDITKALKILPLAPPFSLDSPDPYERFEAENLLRIERKMALKQGRKA